MAESVANAPSASPGAPRSSGAMRTSLASTAASSLAGKTCASLAASGGGAKEAVAADAAAAAADTVDGAPAPPLPLPPMVGSRTTRACLSTTLRPPSGSALSVLKTPS